MNQRISNIKQILTNQSLDALLISSVSNITYLTGYSNFSAEEREAYLFITKKSQYIITDGRYITAIKNDVKDFTPVEVSSANPMRDAITALVKKHSVKSLGVEEHDLTFSEYRLIAACSADSNQGITTAELRIIKEQEEIEIIKEACLLGDKAFNYILKQIKSGVTEKELALKLELFIKEKGADISFKPIIAFGTNAAIPHHQTGDKLLSKNELILLDFGVKLSNYCSDMTRTVFLGKAAAEQKKIYETVLHAQQIAIDLINKNITLQQFNNLPIQEPKSLKASSVDNAARKYIVSQGYPSIPHSLGHAIGIKVHEPPTLSPASKQLLKESMVFSIEPGIYIPDVAGVRIEDLFVIEKNKLRQLTQAPKNLIEL